MECEIHYSWRGMGVEFEIHCSWRGRDIVIHGSWSVVRVCMLICAETETSIGIMYNILEAGLETAISSLGGRRLIH